MADTRSVLDGNLETFLAAFRGIRSDGTDLIEMGALHS
jgi:hypothetical protein